MYPGVWFCFNINSLLFILILEEGKGRERRVLFTNLTALHMQSISFFSCYSSFTKQHYGIILVH